MIFNITLMALTVVFIIKPIHVGPARTVGKLHLVLSARVDLHQLMHNIYFKIVLILYNNA